jgi:hypothetical protein
MRPAVFLRKPLHTLSSLERGTGSAHEMADMIPLFVAWTTIAGGQTERLRPFHARFGAKYSRLSALTAGRDARGPSNRRRPSSLVNGNEARPGR